MAWSSPMTAVPQQLLTAGAFNTYIRDNLLKTLPAIATTEGGLFVTNGVNSLVQRVPASATNDGVEAEITTAGAFAHPAVGDVGPVVTVTTGSSALVFWSARLRSTTAGVITQMSMRVTGATSITADENWMLQYTASAASDQAHVSMAHLFTGLTPGSNSFTALYNKAGAAGTGRAAFRQVYVIPL